VQQRVPNWDKETDAGIAKKEIFFCIVHRQKNVSIEMFEAVFVPIHFFYTIID
jgi:hypothetical protein